MKQRIMVLFLVFSVLGFAAGCTEEEQEEKGELVYLSEVTGFLFFIEIFTNGRVFVMIGNVT